MKVTLLQVVSRKKEYVNKDVMGGYGECCTIGNSFPAKIIERLKKSGIKLPVFVFGYLASILSGNGHKVEFSMGRIQPDSDLVIINSSIVDYRNEIEHAKRIQSDTKAKVGFIGPFATAIPEIFSGIADFVIRGEPETIVQKITDEWIPKGIVDAEPVKDLDSLPFPQWDIFPYKGYSYFPVLKKKPFISVLSSRGCTFSCNYCPYKAYYKHWRARSVGNLIREIKYLIEDLGIKSILFRDPIFTVNRKRAVEIANAIIDAGWKLEWACETHLKYVDKELLDLLYKSGMRGLNVGIESVDESVLKNASRVNADTKHQEDMVKYCDKLGIRVSAFYIFGLPTDTKETVGKTIGYAKKLNTHIAQFFISTPFPGTEFYESVKDKIFTANWEEFTSFTPVFEHNNLTAKEMLDFKEKAFVSYYFRPRYMLAYLRRMLRR